MQVAEAEPPEHWTHYSLIETWGNDAGSSASLSNIPSFSRAARSGIELNIQVFQPTGLKIFPSFENLFKVQLRSQAFGGRE